MRLEFSWSDLACPTFVLHRHRRKQQEEALVLEEAAAIGETDSPRTSILAPEEAEQRARAITGALNGK